MTLRVCFVGVVILFVAQNCYASYPIPRTPMGDEILRRLPQTWHSSRTCPTQTTIEFSVGDDGKIYEPTIDCSGDDQFDAECLEAVCSLSPLTSPSQNESANMLHFVKHFGEKGDIDLRRGIEDKVIQQYLQAHPQPADPNSRFVVVHKIPLSVLWRYPGSFREIDLTSQSNLMAIKIGDPPKDRLLPPHYVSAIANMYASYHRLFKQFPDKIDKHLIVEQSVRAARYEK